VLPANVENLYLQGSATNAYGNAGANYIQGTDHTDLIQGKGGGDALAGMAGGDYFVFSPGEADEAIVLDFSGTGGESDLLLFTGFAPQTTFTAVDATHWQLSYGTTVEVIEFANAATITPSDFLFS
jgi:serralysin